MGLDVYLYKGKKEIEMPSSKYPDHMFKVGYFRSSYNDGGLNTVLKNLALPDLYEIFGESEPDYEFKPNWINALIKVKSTIEDLRSKPNIRCFEVDWNDLSDPTKCGVDSKEGAIAKYLEETSRHSSFDCYSNLSGIFSQEPIKVYGFVHGFRKNIFQKIMTDARQAVTFVIAEGENEWYIQALEIVQETIEYVLAQPDKDKYLLHWSS